MAAKQREPWTVKVVPDGTPEEAEAVAERVRRMLAGWVLRQGPDPASGEEGC